MKKFFSFKIILVAILISTLMLLTGCGKNNEEKKEESANIQETTWTSPVISNGEYYYFISDKSEIKAIRKDNMDFKFLYKPEYTYNVSVDKKEYTIFNDEIYFIQTDYVKDGDYTFEIRKMNVNGKEEATTVLKKSVPYNEKLSKVGQYSAQATSKGLYYTLEGKVYVYNFESQKEEQYNYEITDQNKIESYQLRVSDDGNIYYMKDKKVFKLSKNGIEALKDVPDSTLKDTGLLKRRR